MSARRVVKLTADDGVEHEFTVADVLEALGDDEISDEADERGLTPEPEIEEMSISDMIGRLEESGYEVDAREDADHSSYIDAALRDALADPNTPRSFRDLLYFVHGRTIA